MLKLDDWPPNQAALKDYFVEKLRNKDVFYPFKFGDVICCMGCSREKNPSGRNSWKKKPIEVETYCRTVGDTPNVPLYSCTECGQKQWKPPPLRTTISTSPDGKPITGRIELDDTQVKDLTLKTGD